MTQRGCGVDARQLSPMQRRHNISLLNLGHLTSRASFFDASLGHEQHPLPDFLPSHAWSPCSVARATPIPSHIHRGTKPSLSCHGSRGTGYV